MVETGRDLDIGIRRCRLLLRAYPPSWRAYGRDDELLGVLLASLEASGRVTPSLADATNVVANGLATRVRLLDFVLPTVVRRHIAQVGLAAGTGASAFLLTGGELRIGGWSDGDSPGALDDWLPRPLGPFLTLGVILYALWFVTFGFYLAGQARRCREAAVVTCLLTVAMPTLASLSHHQRPPGGVLATLAVFALGVSALPSWPRISMTSRAGVIVGAAGLAGALAAWRATVILPPTIRSQADDLTSRTMFYWDPRGDRYQLSRALAGAALWVAIGAVVLAAAYWYWDRSWLPVAGFLFIPATTMRLGTTMLDIHRPAHPGLYSSLTIVAVVVAITVHGVLVGRVFHLPWRRRSDDDDDSWYGSNGVV